MKNKTFYGRLRNLYEQAKKGTSVLLIIIVGVVEFLPSELVSPDIASTITISLIFGLSLIMLEIFFDMHKKLTEHLREIKTITSNELLSEIGSLLEGEKNIEIQYMGIAGRHGWVTVLQKFLDMSGDYSLLGRQNVTIKIALISESVLERIDGGSDRYSAIESVVSEIKRAKERLKKQGINNISLELHRYDHIPNFVGFLINGNYLYSSVTYWEEDGEHEQILRGGGTDYMIYDKNDGFGGNYYIKRFERWFEYATGNQAVTSLIKDEEGNSFRKVS